MSKRWENRSDREVVVAAQRGEPGACDALVRRFRRGAAVVTSQVLGPREAAEDAAQEALVTALRCLGQLRDPDRFAGWLCAIARHQARRMLTRERAEATDPATMERLLNADSEPPAGAEHPCLADIVSRLPPAHQVVLRLRYWEEWPVARIAAFLSLPPTTVNWRLHRGRALIRRLLDDEAREP